MPVPLRPSSISARLAAISSKPSRPSVPLPPRPGFFSRSRASRFRTYSRIASRARWIEGVGSDVRYRKSVVVDAEAGCPAGVGGGVNSDGGGMLVMYCAWRTAGAARGTCPVSGERSTHSAQTYPFFDLVHSVGDVDEGVTLGSAVQHMFFDDVRRDIHCHTRCDQSRDNLAGRKEDHG